MSLWDLLARMFGGRDNDNEQPSDEDRELAELIDEFTREGGEGEEYFEEGVEMGTVPSSNPGGPDTDEHEAVKPWWRFW